MSALSPRFLTIPAARRLEAGRDGAESHVNSV